MTRAERIRDKELAEMIGLPLACLRRASAAGKVPTAANLYGQTYTYNLRTIRFWLRKGGAGRIRPPSKARHGIVYVVRCGSFIKIGFTKRLDVRLRSLATGAPEPLQLLSQTPGTTDDERVLQARFSSLRSHGDWFRYEGPVSDWIEAGCPL